MSKSYQKEYRKNMSDEQKQRYRDKQRKYRNNMTNEQKQKQKQREANRRYQKKYRDNMTDEQKQKRREANKRYNVNMSDERKQKLRDYQINYQKKCYAAKKLNNNDKDNDNDNKIIDDNDNDFYCISIIIKLKNIVPIKDINLILKIYKKICSQGYLEGCNFINDGDNKYKIIFLD